jgi:hypothetical protein
MLLTALSLVWNVAGVKLDLCLLEELAGFTSGGSRRQLLLESMIYDLPMTSLKNTNILTS